jgi:hypothetical protein
MDTSEWMQELDTVTQSIKNDFGGISQERLNWKPDASVWSVGQIIDHLIVINNTYFPIFNQLEANQYNFVWFGKITFLPRFFGNLILKSVSPDGGKKMKTLSIWEPSKSQIDIEVIQKFIECQQELKNHIRKSSVLLDQGVVISSPANRIIVYKLETAFEIIVNHEQRHLQQAKELMQLRNSLP